MFRTKIRELRESAGYKSQQAFANAFGVAQSTVGNWEAGAREPNFDTVQKLADFFHVSVDYLLGRENTLRNYPITVVPFYEPYKDAVVFPVVASICAGYNGMAQEEYSDDVEAIPRSMFKGYDPEEMRVFRVSGNSMYPRFLNGDRVLVHVQNDVENGDVAVVWYDCEEVTLKVVNHIPGGVELVPYNPEYQKKRITGPDAEQVHIFGKVLKLIRDV